MDKKRVTGSVVSISRADKNGKCILEVRPDFQGGPSKYTTKFTGIKANDLAEYSDGDRVTVDLKKGKLKDNGDPTDDQKGYWWDFVGIHHGEEAPAQANGHGPATSPAQRGPGAGTGGSSESRERSIERQVALKAAIEWCTAKAQYGPDAKKKDGTPAVAIWNTYHVGQVAQFFAGILDGTVYTKPIHAPKDDAFEEEEPPLFPGIATAAANAQAPTPIRATQTADNVGAVLQWALDTYHLSKAQVFAILGVITGPDIKDLAAARAKIQAAVEAQYAKAQDGQGGVV